MPLPETRQRRSRNFWEPEGLQTSGSSVKRSVVYELSHDQVHHYLGNLWAQPPTPTVDIAESLSPSIVGMPQYNYADAPVIDKHSPNIIFWMAPSKQPIINWSLFLSKPSDLKREFEEQLSVWERETGFLSSITNKIMHPAYLRIIGMGKQVLPLIFARMKERPGHWFVALTAITGEDPVDKGADFATATEQWINWGRSQGYTK